MIRSDSPVYRRRRLRRLVRPGSRIRRRPYRRGLVDVAALCRPAEPQGAVSHLQLLDGLSHEKREQRAVSRGAVVVVRLA